MEKYLKYFFFFLIFTISIISVYFFVRWYKQPLKQIQEGFASSDRFLVSASSSAQRYFPDGYTWVDNRATWGTVNAAQITAKQNAINFFNAFADLAWNRGYSYRYAINNYYIEMSDDMTFFMHTDLSIGVITPKHLRRLPPAMADTIVMYMYNAVSAKLLDIEKNIFTAAYSTPSIGKPNYDSIRADNARRMIPAAWIAQKTMNIKLETFAILEETNNDAAFIYLNSQPELQNYLDQLKMVTQNMAMGIGIGLALEYIPQIVKKVYARIRNTSRALARLISNPSIYGRNAIIAARVGIARQIRRIKTVKTIGQATKIASAAVGGRIARTSTRAVQAAKAALTAAKASTMANPLGAILALFEIIVELIPKDVFREEGKRRAENMIRDYYLRCPIGYMDGQNLETDDFSTIWDYMPIPANFAEIEKEIAKQMTCVTYDENGEQITSDKKQCAQGRTPDQGGGTCFADPPPPMELYPNEPTPPILPTVEDMFARICSEIELNDAANDYFLINGATFDTLETEKTYKRNQGIVLVNFTFSTSNVDTELFGRVTKIFTDAYGTDYQADFFYNNEVGWPAIVSFMKNENLADRNSKAIFILTDTSSTNLLAELKGHLLYEIYTLKLNNPEYFSTADTKVYTEPVKETSIATSKLEVFRNRLLRRYAQHIGKVELYPSLKEEYEQNIIDIEREQKEFISIDIYSEKFLNRCAQFVYDITKGKKQSGRTDLATIPIATWVKYIYAAQVVCNEYVLLAVNLTMINNKIGKEVDFGGEAREIGGDLFGIALGFYLQQNSAGEWIPTAVQDELGNVNSLWNKTIVPVQVINFTPKVVFAEVDYSQSLPVCSNSNFLLQQLSNYQLDFPTKNIKFISGYKSITSNSCLMQWSESDYNPEENTEGTASNRTAKFTYEITSVPYPFDTYYVFRGKEYPTFDAVYAAKGGALVGGEYQGPLTRPIPPRILGYDFDTTTTGILQLVPPVKIPPRGLPFEEFLLDCDIRCSNPVIQKLILEKYNKDNPSAPMINIKNAFTPKPNRCDFTANINTGRGTVQEQKRRAILKQKTDQTGTPIPCSFEVESIGAAGTGTFIPTPEGFQNYQGYSYVSTVVDGRTLPRYTFGDKVFGDIITDSGHTFTLTDIKKEVQQTDSSLFSIMSNARLNLYSILGITNRLDSCPLQCSNDKIISKIAGYFNENGYPDEKMQHISKITTAGPLACDVVYRYTGVNSNQGTLVAGKFVPAPIDETRFARFSLRKIPTSCDFQVTGFEGMNGNPGITAIENISTPLFTANPKAPGFTTPRNTSSILGCIPDSICQDPNNILQMINFYNLTEQRSVSTVYRTANLGKSQCQMELWYWYMDRDWSKTTKNVDGTWPQKLNSGIDTYNFTFKRQSERCYFKLQSGTRDSTSGFKKSAYMDSLNIPQNPIAASNITYIFPNCPVSIDCSNPTIQSEAATYYANQRLSGYKDTMRVLSSFTLSSNTCEFAIGRTYPSGEYQTYGTTVLGDPNTRANSNLFYPAYHKKYTFIADADCGGYTAIKEEDIQYSNSYTNGGLRPENPACYPINCMTPSLSTMVLSKIPRAWLKDNPYIVSTMSVSSNLCEYDIGYNNYGTRDEQRLTTSYDSKFHLTAKFKSIGAACETSILEFTENIPQSAARLYSPFSCPSFTGSNSSIYTTVQASLKTYINSLSATTILLFGSGGVAPKGSDILGVKVIKAIDYPQKGSFMVAYEVALTVYLNYSSSRPSGKQYAGNYDLNLSWSLNRNYSDKSGLYYLVEFNFPDRNCGNPQIKTVSLLSESDWSATFGAAEAAAAAVVAAAAAAAEAQRIAAEAAAKVAAEAAAKAAAEAAAAAAAARVTLANLDAATYISGSTWTATAGRSFTLFNGPTVAKLPSQSNVLVFNGLNYAFDSTGFTQSEITQTYDANKFYTVELWFNTNSTDKRALVTQYNQASLGGTQTPILSINNNKVYGYTYMLSEIGSFTANTWTHVAYRHTPSEITSFINGANPKVLLRSQGKSWPTRTHFGIASASLDGIDTYKNFKGAIAVVKLYNYALTNTEILASYNAVLPRFSGYTNTPYIVPPQTIAVVSNGLITRLDASTITSWDGVKPSYEMWDSTGTAKIHQRFYRETDFNDTLPLIEKTPTDAITLKFEGTRYSFNMDGINPATLTLTTAFTLEVWFKAAAGASGTLLTELEGHYISPAASRKLSLLAIKDNTVRVRFNTTTGGTTEYSIGTYIPDTWNCVGFTYLASAQRLRGYLNGTLAGTAPAITKKWQATATSKVYIGMAENLGDGFGYFTGGIADFKLYNRELTEAEMKQNYNSLAPRFEIPQKL